MKIVRLISITALLTLSACATVDPSKYDDYSCNALRSLMKRSEMPSVSTARLLEESREASLTGGNIDQIINAPRSLSDETRIRHSEIRQAYTNKSCG